MGIIFQLTLKTRSLYGQGFIVKFHSLSATETNPSLVCSSSFSWPDIGTTDISLKETRMNSEKGKPDDDLGHVIGKQLTVEEREHYLLSSVVNQTPLESSSLAKETGTAACEDMRGGEPRLARTQSIYLENNCHPDGIDQLENSDADDFVKSKTLKHSELPAIPTTHSDCDQALDPCYEELPSPPESVHCLIKLKDLPKQLQGKNSDPEDTITDELKKLPTGQKHPWTVGTLRKNSNTGILPYDHSRVKLDKNDLDYYNANYLKVHPSQTFIAAQGPSERTAEVFWRMVWSEKVKIIINLRQTLKSAFQYWPSGVESNKTFGEYTLIWFKNSHESMDISVKDIKIVKGDKVHEVKICHFLSWPDGSIPPQSVSLIDFIKDIKALKIKSAPLVHCSNGVGATGTFIALYCLMDDLKDSKKTGLSVSSFVNRMRKDRVNMIENELQYWFLYECLVVALLSHEKKTLADGIMMNLTQEDEITQEYKVLQTFRCYSVQRSFHIGQQPENVGKNRYSTVLPADFARAVLQTPGSLQGYTDYINASVVDSCFSKDAFIMTQSPLPTTAEDFWRMVHDYDCAAVVCLNQMDENDETICSYWPDSGSKEYGNMVVECKDTAVKDKHCSQCKLSVKCLKNKRVVTVDHYQLIEWSQDSDQTDGIIELIGKIKPITDEKRTIVVHCMDGASRCGVFVSALLEISVVRESKTRRLFETVHKLSGQNPHVMKSLDDYHLCHHLVKAVLVEDESKYQEVI
ncbi:putative receptor-type tyrosine-protein phosphatase epsilon-like isoform X6 [Apostichopus japonicus]|uniref:protein-tyrosine-phosphatase n=1 Tax=Stichopus japonicus TaxID=307972 RepID=A0A2G8JK09_STIJA|nr:putative receptor-type tyrosine-protein phosphatase epsilon-like isoform X6 [Apostichopus japonicus]